MGDNIEDDDDWTPPSAADMKIIEARQERSNQISKLMGDYMLKGYRMLDRICHCGTILLQDRNGADYCVACNELETECAKDDPVLSSQAARVAALEGRSEAPQSSNIQNQRMAVYQAAEANTHTIPSQQQQPTQTHGDAAREHPVSLDATKASSAVLELQKQIVAASNELKDCGSLEMRIQLCNLIKAASEALLALNKINSPS